MNSKFTLITRILLGIILLLSGLNKILKIIPTPADNLIESFGEVDYIFPIVAALEISIAILLLSKKWVAFALIVLVPLSLNILLFHIYLNFEGIIPAILVAALNGILLYKHRRQYAPLFE
ncbi:DoxX family membrane protein [Flavobacterium antarcticum]|uniref:DoxX family membrane protein n=1 Tax=Flavobacterium antarcticum TaxID=271155 RepID=UPI0003B3826A|nr:DoxX family membrane protein [Flavobacterium antarcticum]